MTRQRPGYQAEPTELREKIWARGHATAWEFLRICAWKSAQNLANLPLNPEQLIEERTGSACGALRWARALDVRQQPPNWDQWEDAVRSAIGSKQHETGLLGLVGVGYPVATAFLCILNPRAFPVLDRWAISHLFGPTSRTASHFNAAGYRRFTKELVDHGASADAHLSVHDLDQVAMDSARAQQPPPEE